MNDAQTTVSVGQPFQSEPPPRKARGRTLMEFEKDFDEYPAERELLEKCRLGEPCKLNDSKRPEVYEPTLCIRADFIRFLALGGDDNAAVHEHGMVLFGAWIKGTLDLGDVELLHQLQLVWCHLDGLMANDARARSIILNGSYFESRVHALRCHCVMLWAEDCVFKDGADFSYLIVDNEIRLSKSRFEVIVPTALGGEKAPERADFALNLVASRVGGNAICSDMNLSAGKSASLNLEIASIEGYALFRRITAEGGVSSPGLNVVRNMDFSGACIRAGGLDCGGAIIGGDVGLIAGFLLGGTFNLTAAKIKGGLLCFTAQDPDKPGSGPFLPAAQIVNGSDPALVAQKARFGRVMLDGVVFSGGVNFSDSVVEGEFSIKGVLLAGKAATTLNFQHARVSSVFRFRDLVACPEEVAHAACVERMEAARESDAIPPLNSVVASKAVHGTFEFKQMQIDSLDDDFASWKLASGKIDFDDFEYKRLTYPFTTDANAQGGKEGWGIKDFLGLDHPELRLGRVEWLALQKPSNLNTENYRPQPWIQLASTLRAMGHLKDARGVSIAQQYQLREAKRVRRGELQLHYFFGLFSRFGYHPLRLALWLCVPWILASLLFWIAVNPEIRPWPDSTGYWIEPTRQVPDFECLARHAGEVPGPRCLRTPSYSEFFPPAHAADTLLPIISLGYKASWQPVITDAKGAYLAGGLVVQLTSWFLIIIGWIGGAMLAGAVGTLVRKD